MASIGTISVKLVALTNEFMSGLNKAGSKLNAFTSGVQGTGTRLGSAFGFIQNKWMGLVGALGISVGVSALVGLTKNAFSAIDAMDELSSKTGLSVEKLQALQYAAKFSGVSADQLTTAILKMQKTIVSGSKFFDAAGMDVNQLLGMNADQQIGAIADKLSGMGDAAEKTAFATAMFGKAGAHLLPFLENGSQGLSQLEQELQDTGQAYSSMDATKVAIAADSIDRMKTAVGALFNEIAIQLSPAILDITNRFVEWANSGEGAGVMVRNALGMVIDSIGWVMDAFQGVGTIFSQVGQIISEGFSYISTDIQGASTATISLGTIFYSFGAGVNDILANISGAFGYMFARIQLGFNDMVVAFLAALQGMISGATTPLGKLTSMLEFVPGLGAGISTAKFAMEMTGGDDAIDNALKSAQEKSKALADTMGNEGGWEKHFRENAKALNGEIDKISQAQKPSSQLDQWWASIDDKMENQVAQHENIAQMEDDGLDLEKLKTQEKEKQKKIEQGGFIISKAGRTAFGADTTFGGTPEKPIGLASNTNTKDTEIVSELQEQTGYLRQIASKPMTASFA